MCVVRTSSTRAVRLRHLDAGLEVPDPMTPHLEHPGWTHSSLIPRKKSHKYIYIYKYRSPLLSTNSLFPAPSPDLVPLSSKVFLAGASDHGGHIWIHLHSHGPLRGPNLQPQRQPRRGRRPNARSKSQIRKAPVILLGAPLPETHAHAYPQAPHRNDRRGRVGNGVRVPAPACA